MQITGAGLPGRWVPSSSYQPDLVSGRAAPKAPTGTAVAAAVAAVAPPTSHSAVRTEGIVPSRPRTSHFIVHAPAAASQDAKERSANLGAGTQTGGTSATDAAAVVAGEAVAADIGNMFVRAHSLADAAQSAQAIAASAAGVAAGAKARASKALITAQYFAALKPGTDQANCAAAAAVLAREAADTAHDDELATAAVASTTLALAKSAFTGAETAEAAATPPKLDTSVVAHTPADARRGSSTRTHSFRISNIHSVSGAGGLGALAEDEILSSVATTAAEVATPSSYKGASLRSWSSDTPGCSAGGASAPRTTTSSGGGASLSGPHPETAVSAASAAAPATSAADPVSECRPPSPRTVTPPSLGTAAPAAPATAKRGVFSGIRNMFRGFKLKKGSTKSSQAEAAALDVVTGQSVATPPQPVTSPVAAAPIRPSRLFLTVARWDPARLERFISCYHEQDFAANGSYQEAYVPFQTKMLVLPVATWDLLRVRRFEAYYMDQQAMALAAFSRWAFAGQAAPAAGRWVDGEVCYEAPGVLPTYGPGWCFGRSVVIKTKPPKLSKAAAVPAPPSSSRTCSSAYKGSVQAADRVQRCGQVKHVLANCRAGQAQVREDKAAEDLEVAQGCDPQQVRTMHASHSDVLRAGSHRLCFIEIIILGIISLFSHHHS